MIKLGCGSRSELFADLQSNEQTMAKVFVAILTNGLPGADALPWRFGEGGGSKDLAADISQFLFHGAPTWKPPAPFLTSSGLVFGSSVIERTLVAQFVSGDPRAVDVRSAGMPRQVGMRVVPPARVADNRALDLTFDAKADANGDSVLEMRLNAGPADQFGGLADATAQLVEAIIDEADSSAMAFGG
jgi:hypothetical protein